MTSFKLLNCVVPENIYTHPKKGFLINSKGELGSKKDKAKYELKLPEGLRGLSE